MNKSSNITHSITIPNPRKENMRTPSGREKWPKRICQTRTATFNNGADEDKDNDHHDELLVVSPHRRVSISDSTAEMASILCHVILLLSVMTQHLYSHWYFFSSSSTNHNQTTIHMRLSSKRIQVRSAFIATVGCCSFDFVLVVFGCASCMDSHVN